MLLVDRNEEINRELRHLRRLWFDPVIRFKKWQKITTSGVDGGWIGRRRDGSIERVRYAGGNSKALLLAEYKALQKVSHENLVKLRWAAMYDRRLYVSTSWVDVEPRKAWPIPIRTLLAQMECAALGVAALHAKGLVHGDLKPETILWDGDSAVVTDLKLAAPAGRRERASFSPKFAAPEQILEESVGPEADVYALGVTLYSLFIRDRFPSLLKTEETTNKPGKREGLSAATAFHQPNEKNARVGEDWIVGAKVLFRNRLSSVVEGVQDAGLIGSVLGIVRKACELDPQKRHRDAGAFADALRDCRGGL